MKEGPSWGSSVPSWCNTARSFLEGEEVSFGEQSVEARVGLASLAHETSQGENVFLSGHSALFVDLYRHAQM